MSETDFILGALYPKVGLALDATSSCIVKKERASRWLHRTPFVDLDQTTERIGRLFSTYRPYHRRRAFRHHRLLLRPSFRLP
jgi:hypothetical protein